MLGLFYVHKDFENYSKELLLLLLLKLFHELEIDLKKFHNFWEDAYLNEKNNIEKIKKKMYNLNIKNKSDDEWDDLQPKLK